MAKLGISETTEGKATILSFFARVADEGTLVGRTTKTLPDGTKVLTETRKGTIEGPSGVRMNADVSFEVMEDGSKKWVSAIFYE